MASIGQPSTIYAVLCTVRDRPSSVSCYTESQWMWIVCMTARFDITPKTTEQNRIVRIGKSEAKVTSNKLRFRYCTIEANYWLDTKHCTASLRQQSYFLHYAVADYTEVFRLSLVLDQIFGVILKIRPNSGLILKIRLNISRHLKNLSRLGLRPEFGLRTKSDLFYQVTQCNICFNNTVDNKRSTCCGG